MPIAHVAPCRPERAQHRARQKSPACTAYGAYIMACITDVRMQGEAAGLLMALAACFLG
ncbi:hypothetical protein DFH94DRAFT_195713 [Russula ochroleuca]|uniref:Uncharacterized protein n=1 Tax=Russula ochroleuca TaxID=152965 RepID=A0A9P5JZX4_9AGAM|nr:hypothetical protein DFH94DRAFT_195713 [Russula ochroleuca]